MRKTYKRLGNYIELVNVRNSDLKDIPLVGLSINKVFIPSIANTIGTNMANYKVIKRNQFAYGPVTSRNGEKITIALFKDYDEALISQAYLPFEIIKPDELLPEYLMMWFSRPEFDRYARYKSHGSARETFDWAEMCEVELPVPSIEKQQKIVSEYQTIENKIKVNEQICEKLEATAQAIYREWFVEFNFPDENGKPYKDNCGKMVWNEELEKDVPEVWKVGSLSSLTNDMIGGDWGKESPTGNYNSKVYCIRGTDIPNLNKVNKDTLPVRYILNKNLKGRRLQSGNIVIELSGGSPIQSTGRSTLITEELMKFVDSNLICSNFCRVLKIEEGFETLYSETMNYFYNMGLFFTYENSTHGVKNLAINNLLEDLKLSYHSETISQFNEMLRKIEHFKFKTLHQNYYLDSLKSVILTNLAKLI